MFNFNKLGVAPIAWTNDDMPELGRENSFRQCISEMALAGYKGTEIGCKYPSDLQELKDELTVRELKVCNQWFSSFLISRPFPEVETAFRRQLERLSFLGAEIIGASEQTGSIQGDFSKSILDEKPLFNSAEWEKLGSGLNRLGKIARDEYGIRLAYHHHMGTGIQTGEEVERLLDICPEENLGLLYDSGHFAFSGEDPVARFRQFESRTIHVHLKDMRSEIYARVKPEKMSFLQAVKEGVFTVPGDGVIDFRPIVEGLNQSDYKGWVVVEAEQDPAAADPFVYSKMSMEYLTALLEEK